MEVVPTRHLRLAEITPEHPPERLIEIIQNLTGKIPKEEREQALIELIRRSQFLIQKVTNHLYYTYDQGPKHRYDYADFQQDVLLEFIHLVTLDFKIKDQDNPNDTGYAVFGNYIKVKLYRRVQYKMQERLKKTNWGKDVPVGTWLSEPYGSVDATDSAGSMGAGESITPAGKHIWNELNEALLANCLNYDDLVLDNILDEDIKMIVAEIMEIAQTVLNERDYRVWSLYYCSGVMVGEIGKMVPSKDGEERVMGRQLVLKVAQNANDKVIREYGRRSVLRRASL